MGNYVPITTTPNDIYGKIMSIPDRSMPVYSRLVTRWSPEVIEKIEEALSVGELHPRDAKMKLAFEVTSAFYGKQEADTAQKDFIQKFQKKTIPDNIDDFSISKEAICLDVLVAAGLVNSRGQGRRMVEQNAVKLDGAVISNWNDQMHAGVLQVGKRKFIRLIEA